jgi:hypothetical protein
LIKPLVEINDNGKLTLNFHPGQLKAWKSKARFVFILAGTQSGKTSFGGFWLYKEIKNKGPGDYLAVSPTYDLFRLKMLPEMLSIFVDLLKIGRYYPSERLIEIADPKTGEFLAKKASDRMYGRIILRSAEAGSKHGGAGVGGLESATAKAAWLDECGMDTFSLAAWEAVLRRLSLSQGRVLGTTTIYNHGWLKSELYDRWQKGNESIDIIQFESLLNPAFPRSEYERAYSTLPEWKFNLLYRGRYDRPAGMIYGDFDSAVHVVPDFQIPIDWNRFVGIDPGAIHTALIWLAGDTERDSFYIYRESLEGDLTTREHASKAKAQAEGEHVKKWVGGSKSEKQFRLDWKDAGINIEEPAIIDVEAGIDRVIDLLKAKRLYIFSSCRGIKDEFGTYSRKLNDRGEPTEVIQNKERFHQLDALRYVVSNLSTAKDNGSNVITSYFIPNLDLYGTRRF